MDNIKDIFPKRPWYKRPLLLILIGLFIIVSIIFVMVVFNQKQETGIGESTASSTPKKILTDQERSDIVEQLSATATSSVSPTQKANIIKQLSSSPTPKTTTTDVKVSNPTVKTGVVDKQTVAATTTVTDTDKAQIIKDLTPTTQLTDAEREAIINQLSN